MIQEKINFGGWSNCIKLTNGSIELIATTDVGPRILKLGFTGGRNLMFVSPEDKGKTGGDQWRIYGGHRLWHAPEVMPRTFFPDNSPVKYKWDGKMLKLMQEKESSTGISKEMEITMDHRRDQISILHRLVIETLLDARQLPKAEYVHLVDELVEFLQRGDQPGGEPFPLATLVMPATVEHVRRISESQERMPAKSTYFYPKLLSGLVINPLE